MATDVADGLVNTCNVAFRNAHHLIGALVAAADEAGIPLDQLPASTRNRFLPSKIADRVTDHIWADWTCPKKAVRRRSHIGGTSPVRVRAHAKRVLSSIKKQTANSKHAQKK